MTLDHSKLRKQRQPTHNSVKVSFLLDNSNIFSRRAPTGFQSRARKYLAKIQKGVDAQEQRIEELAREVEQLIQIRNANAPTKCSNQVKV